MKQPVTPISTTLTLVILISTTLALEAEVVNTTLGPIQGLRKNIKGKKVDAYYRIPYAKPPVGPLRFKRPQPAEPWNDLKVTKNKSNSCFQSIDTAWGGFPGVEMWNPNTPMSEDCLYLNVWVPRGTTPIRTTMVWIYGGAFNAGSSTLDVYEGSILAATQNVIVASMNYRLGPLGFLYTNTTEAPGNQGLLDQNLALKWIYDNIASFGGDPKSITIFGESAGALSVGYHLMSSMSMNLFTRAIMQSGAPLGDTFFMRHDKAINRGLSLANSLKCPSSPVPEMMKCLHNVPAQKITAAQRNIFTLDLYYDTTMTPVVDGYFLTDEPKMLLAQGAIKDTELLIGVNKDEGVYFLVYGFPTVFQSTTPPNITDAEFKEMIKVLTFNGNNIVIKAFTYEYVNKIVPAQRDPYRDIADDISGDSIIICPTIDFANAFASLNGGQRAVYQYLFDHNLSNNPWPGWMGVMHGYEIEAVFGLPVDYNYTQAEQDLADRVMGYWTRFAQTGDPNVNSKNATWPKLTSNEAKYLQIRGEGDRVRQGLRREKCAFLSELLPLLSYGTDH